MCNSKGQNVTPPRRYGCCARCPISPRCPVSFESKTQDSLYSQHSKFKRKKSKSRLLFRSFSCTCGMILRIWWPHTSILTVLPQVAAAGNDGARVSYAAARCCSARCCRDSRWLPIARLLIFRHQTVRGRGYQNLDQSLSERASHLVQAELVN